MRLTVKTGISFYWFEREILVQTFKSKSMKPKLYLRLKFACFFLVMLCNTAFAQTHVYFFNSNFNEAGGGPALTELLSCNATQGSFVQETITTSAGSCANGAAANTFHFNAGGGLQYPNTDNFISTTYTIQVFFKFSQELNGYSRIIDFSNSTADAGIYLLGKCLNFYPSGNIGTTCPFEINKYYLVSFSRNGTTGIISVYVNGELFTSFSDVNNLYRLPSSTPLIFFRDDNVVTCEVKAGNVKYISISNLASDATAIANVWTNICDIALPVSGLKFLGSIVAKQAQLQWQTATEINTSHFDVEKSTDGTHFILAGRVNAKGHSTNISSYQFTDKIFVKGDVFYRLKTVDRDGRFSYSPIIKLTLNDNGGLQTFPSPVKDVLTVSGLNNGGTLRLVSATGAHLLQQRVSSQTTTLNLVNLPAGIYYLQVWNGSSWQQQKITKQ